VKLLLTGAPRSGKSTLVRRLVEAYPGIAGGIIGVELVGPDRRRCGFELQTVWKAPDAGFAVVERTVLARAEAPGDWQVGRYGVRAGALAMAVRALDGAMHEGGLVIIDEIGPLLLVSPAFQDAVLRCLDGPGHLLATLSQSQDPFLEGLRARPGVRSVEVNRANRQHLAESLRTWVSGQYRI
jgi:nucleoside-triphosphatase